MQRKGRLPLLRIFTHQRSAQPTSLPSPMYTRAYKVLQRCVWSPHIRQNPDEEMTIRVQFRQETRLPQVRNAEQARRIGEYFTDAARVQRKLRFQRTRDTLCAAPHAPWDHTLTQCSPVRRILNPEICFLSVLYSLPGAGLSLLRGALEFGFGHTTRKKSVSRSLPF